MDERWPKAGDKMRFLGKNGYDFQPPLAIEAGFVVGEEYTVEDIRIGGWEHSIKFEGMPNRHNGVMFEPVE